MVVASARNLSPAQAFWMLLFGSLTVTQNPHPLYPRLSVFGSGLCTGDLSKWDTTTAEDKDAVRES